MPKAVHDREFAARKLRVMTVTLGQECGLGAVADGCMRMTGFAPQVWQQAAKTCRSRLQSGISMAASHFQWHS